MLKDVKWNQTVAADTGGKARGDQTRRARGWPYVCKGHLYQWSYFLFTSPTSLPKLNSYVQFYGHKSFYSRFGSDFEWVSNTLVTNNKPRPQRLSNHSTVDILNWASFFRLPTNCVKTTRPSSEIRQK